MKKLKGIPNAQYHQMEGLSSSDLRLFWKNPYHYYIKNNRQEYKKQYEYGTLIHTMILEPDKVNENLTVLEYDSYRTKAAKEERDQAIQENKNVLLAHEYEQIKLMVDSYRQFNIVHDFLQGGEAEQSIFWTDEASGIKCKCRPDYMNLKENYIIDVKSCEDIDKMIRSVYNYGYYIQAAHYQMGTGVRDFYILALSKQEPYDVEMFQLGPALLEQGQSICRQALDGMRQCINNEHWPNKHGQKVRLLELDERTTN